MNKESSLEEFHDRDYSIFDSKEHEAIALTELHKCSYMIFDEEETQNLLIENEEELSKLSHDVSFLFLQISFHNQELFTLRHPKPTENRPDKELLSIIDSLLAHQIKKEANQKVDRIKKYDCSKVFKLAIPSLHFFYIRIPDAGFGRCDAFGTYDPQTGQFVIKEGSNFPFDVPSQFRYTPIDIQRRLFLRKYCSRVRENNYRLIKDAIFKSPTHAAKIVKGINCDGWTEWVDECGMSLKDVYK